MKIKNSLLLLMIIISIIVTSCQTNEARYPVNVSSGIDYNSSIELSKKINQKEEIRFREYQRSKNIKFERSNFGFLFNINNNIDSLIKSRDEVNYTLIVENLNGVVIYQKISKTLIVDHQDEIKGMHEGLKLMSKGAQAIFIFPSHQAFGFHGDGKKIKSNTPLIYKVEIIDVQNQKGKISNK